MKDSGYIDLGQKYDPSEIKKEETGPKVNYPTMFIRHKMEGKDNPLDSLPDGEFTFQGKGKIVSYKENNKDGTCECEIEVTGIKPDEPKAKAKKDSGDSLDSALDEVAKKKTAKAAPAASEDDDGEDEDAAEEAKEIPAEEADEEEDEDDEGGSK